MTFADDAFTVRPRILVIDDDRVLTTLFARLLADTGDVTTSNSGADGLALARRIQPDLILLDVQMPGQDGFDIINELKTDPTVRHIPVIFITAEILPEIESHCLEAGAADYIAKPVNARVLQARARTHLLIKQQADQLADLAYRDALTGTLNRGAFQERLDSECRRAARNSQPVSLVLIDVDNFRAYNEVYGHLAGDDVLTGVVTAVRSVIKRPGDVLARFDGQTIAVLLPETPAPDAAGAAERIRAAVSELSIRHSGSSVAEVVTVTIGVAGTSNKVSAAELLAAADAQVERAKGLGRNQVAYIDGLSPAGGTANT